MDCVRDYLESIADMVTNSKLPGSGCLPNGAIETIKNINEATANAFINIFNTEQPMVI